MNMKKFLVTFRSFANVSKSGQGSDFAFGWSWLQAVGWETNFLTKQATNIT
jgi:hypothetical protein